MTDQPNELFTVMTRESLDDLPQFPLPDGYRVRWYRPGDERDWLAIHEAAYAPETITLDVFRREFPDQEALAQRQCFILDPDGAPVATATAWIHNNGFDARYGCVHWVAVAPQAQRLGLGKALMTILLERFKALGYSRAYLRTSNPAAIRLYQQAGFAVISTPGSG